MIILAKTFEFSAAHRLFRPEWSREKNFEMYGKCSSENGHGHNYTLEVQVAGNPDPESGMVLDATILDRLVQESIIRDVDHKNLDLDVKWFRGQVSTVENLLCAMWDQFAIALEKSSVRVDLHQMVLWETKRVYAIRSRSLPYRL